MGNGKERRGEGGFDLERARVCGSELRLREQCNECGNRPREVDQGREGRREEASRNTWLCDRERERGRRGENDEQGTNETRAGERALMATSCCVVLCMCACL